MNLAQQIRELPIPEMQFYGPPNQQAVAESSFQSGWMHCDNSIANIIRTDDIASRLKKPEWVENHRGDGVWDTILGRYQVWIGKRPLCRFSDGALDSTVTTVADCKAACESDFKRRILEAFE